MNNSYPLITATAATATQTSNDMTNSEARGVKVVLDVTAIVATHSLTLHIQGKDPVSGKYFDLLVGAAVTGVSTNVYTVYPGLTAAANVTATDVLPYQWRVQVVHGDTDAATYTVAASTIQ